MKLFDGYVRNYHTFNLTVEHGKHSFTMTEIEYFSRLGSMLGYHPFTEDTSSSTRRPMDLSWWGYYEDGYWYGLILHLERENLYKKDEETLEKLFNEREDKPVNVIGIMNVRNRLRVEELVDIAKAKNNSGNALLILKTNSTGRDQLYFDEVYAYFLNMSEVVATKVAYVSDIEGTLYMHFH